MGLTYTATGFVVHRNTAMNARRSACSFLIEAPGAARELQIRHNPVTPWLIPNQYGYFDVAYVLPQSSDVQTASGPYAPQACGFQPPFEPHKGRTRRTPRLPQPGRSREALCSLPPGLGVHEFSAFAGSKRLRAPG